MVHKKNAWIVVPLEDGASHTSLSMNDDVMGKRRRKKARLEFDGLDEHGGVDESLFSVTAPAAQDSSLNTPAQSSKAYDIVELDDIRKEYQLVLVKLKFRNQFNEDDVSTLNPTETVLLYMRAHKYEEALTVAKLFDELNIGIIFESLAEKCVRCTLAERRGLAIAPQDIVVDVIASLDSSVQNKGAWSVSERSWKLLKGYLEQYEKSSLSDGATAGLLETTGDHHDKQTSVDGSGAIAASGSVTTNASSGNMMELRRRIIESVLRVDKDFNLPPWLIAPFRKRNPEDLVRLYLQHGLLESAIEFAVKYIQSVSCDFFIERI